MIQLKEMSLQTTAAVKILSQLSWHHRLTWSSLTAIHAEAFRKIAIARPCSLFVEAE